MEIREESLLPHIAAGIEKNGKVYHHIQQKSPDGRKKRRFCRQWMRLDKHGASEMLELDRSMIMERVSIPARDLRILGPIFSNSSNILAREKAMVVNLEFVKAIVSAEEVLILEPEKSSILSFIDRLREHLPPTASEVREENEFPFEFMVLEVALDSITTFLGSNVSDLERIAYPSLEKLTLNVSTGNLEHIRGLKGDLTRLLSRVQKVRDELENLLDDNEGMAQLYLTRKSIFSRQTGSFRNNLGSWSSFRITRIISRRFSNASVASLGENGIDLEELEMLLESYFMRIDCTRNKLLAIREHIDHTEVYVNIQLDKQRNDMIEFHITMITVSFAITVGSFVTGVFGMNLPCPLYRMNGVFEPFLGALLSICTLLFFSIFSYARWKGYYLDS